MDDKDKSKEQLIKELAELRERYYSRGFPVSQMLDAESGIRDNDPCHEELLEIRDSYIELMEQSRDVIFTLSTEGIILSLNRAFERITGWSAGDWIGKPFSALIRPEDISMAWTRISDILNGGSPEAIELRFRKISGDYVEGEILASLQLKKGIKTGILGIGRDISERKLVENALRESEERFRTLSSIAGEGIMIHENGIILDTNQAFARIAGYSGPNDLIGKNGFDAMRFTPESKKIILDHIRDDSDDTYDIELIGPDGNTVPAETGGREIIYMGRKARLVYMRDITERKKAEVALEESKALLISIIDSTKDLIWSVDSDRFSLLTFNKGLEDFFLKEGIEISTGMLLEDILPEKLANKLFILYSQTLELGAQATMYQTTLGNLTLWINLQVLSRDNKPYAISAFARDITDLMKAEEALIIAKNKAEESDRLKTAFMNNISHEVRTPLNGILGFAQFAFQPEITREEKNYYLDLLNTSSERLLNTITNYMDISLIVSGGIIVHYQKVCLSDLIDGLYKKYSKKCRVKNLDFNKQISSDCIDSTLICDPSLLEKSISQLLDNAVKFTGTGSIDLGLSIKDNEYEIVVKDSGRGIAPEAQEKIFDYFIQEETSITRGYEGSGLGLSIARGLVELMGGKIRMESAKDRGSKFVMIFPVREKTPDTVELTEKRKSASGKKISPVILVADDDEISCSFYRTILKAASFSYLSAANGLEAVEACRNHPEISLVLMDIKMPVMDGLEATFRIRKFRKDLPVIGISAYSMISDRNKAIEAGCDEYITKPVSSALLLSTISKHLE